MMIYIYIHKTKKPHVCRATLLPSGYSWEIIAGTDVGVLSTNIILLCPRPVVEFRCVCLFRRGLFVSRSGQIGVGEQAIGLIIKPVCRRRFSFVCPWV